MNPIPIPHEELKRLLHYDPETGRFTRLVAVSIVKKHGVGSVAGFTHAQGYRIVKLGPYRAWEHRLAIFYMTGRWPTEVDHINRIKDDNRFSNLREVTPSENVHNRDLNVSKGKAGMVGVVEDRGRFQAVLTYRGKKIYLGSFRSAKAAHDKYIAARAERGLSTL